MDTAIADKKAATTGPGTRVTINHLAASLGLTKGTVSRALNGYPDISERTRCRVARQAAEMGYRPLSHAQAIKTGRTRSIGLVLQADVHDAQRPFLADFLAGATLSASEENWTLTVATATCQSEMTGTLTRLIDERKADGYILPRTKVHDDRVAMLRKAQVPFVLFGRTSKSTGCAWFDVRGEDAMAQAVARLVGFGHREIGFVNSRLEYNYAVLREDGFRKGMQDAGLTVDENLICSGAMTADEGKSAARRLLTSPTPPTAIVFATDMAAIGAYAAAADLNLKVSRDFSIIAYDGIPEGAFTTPPLTTFNVDMHKAGSRLASLLIRRIRGDAPAELRETSLASLRVRHSDGPLRLTSKELAERIKKHQQNNT